MKGGDGSSRLLSVQQSVGPCVGDLQTQRDLNNWDEMPRHHGSP